MTNKRADFLSRMTLHSLLEKLISHSRYSSQLMVMNGRTGRPYTCIASEESMKSLIKTLNTLALAWGDYNRRNLVRR